MKFHALLVIATVAPACALSIVESLSHLPALEARPAVTIEDSLIAVVVARLLSEPGAPVYLGPDGARFAIILRSEELAGPSIPSLEQVRLVPITEEMLHDLSDKHGRVRYLQLGPVEAFGDSGSVSFQIGSVNTHERSLGPPDYAVCRVRLVREASRWLQGQDLCLVF